jgi:hypothetical protein
MGRGDDLYTQCRLRKDGLVRLSWIPRTFAKVGRMLKLREGKEAPWDDGWRVEGVFATRKLSEIQGEANFPSIERDKED